MYTEDGEVLKGIVFDPEWGGGGLCAEAEPLLAAHRMGKRISAVATVGRLDANDPIVILTPCGICQERLYHWGLDVEIAVPDEQDGSRWMMRTLGQIQPHHWVEVYSRYPYKP
jgi:cytidine deaminase